MNLRILLALSILANSTASILRSNSINRIPKSATKCDSTIHSITDIFSQFSECFFKKYEHSRELSSKLTALSRECFAPSPEAASPSGKCPIRPFSHDQPSFSHLPKGHAFLLLPVFNFLNGMVKSFLTDPACFVKSYKPAFMNEFHAYAKAQNKEFTPRIQLSQVEESNSKETWNNWLNAVMIEITRAVAMHECETKYSETEQSGTISCINEFEIYAGVTTFDDRPFELEKCQKLLGSDCGAVFDKVQKTGCDFVQNIRDQVRDIMFEIRKDYANNTKLILNAVALRRMGNEEFVMKCTDFMKSAFVTKTQDWFNLIKSTTDDCAPNGSSFDTVIDNFCWQVKDSLRKVNEKFLRSLTTIVDTVVDAVFKDVVYLSGYCV